MVVTLCYRSLGSARFAEAFRGTPSWRPGRAGPQFPDYPMQLCGVESVLLETPANERENGVVVTAPEELRPVVATTRSALKTQSL